LGNGRLAVSGVTKVDVTRFGKKEKVMTFFSLSPTFTTRTISTFPADGLSSVLVNSAAKVHFQRLSPIDGVTRGGPPPLVTPLLAITQLFYRAAWNADAV